jgi:hypothetical protein
MTTLLRLIPNIRRDRPRAASRWALALLWTLGLGLAGCGGEPSAVSLPKETLHPVKGSVTTAEGTPLTEGTITFVPVKGTISREASGKIGADGTFTLKSGDTNEGAAEGEYRVKIESPLTTPSTDPKKPNRVVPLAYEDEVSSQITITIKSGPNDLPPIKLVPVDPRNAAGAKEPIRD